MRKLYGISLLILVCFNLIPVLGWEPEPVEHLYSEIDDGVYVRLVYGGLLDQPIEIPKDKDTLPTPELNIVMGGIERYGYRNVTITTYEYNRTSHEWDIMNKNTTIKMERGVGGYRFVAYRKVIFPVINDTLRVQFKYLDIEEFFWYKPDPLYVYRERTELDVRIRGMIMVGFAVLAFVMAAIAGRRLQRRATVVPALPVLAGMMFIIGVVAFISSLILFQYAGEGFDLLIRGFLSLDWLLLYPALFGVFTLWLASRHVGDILKELQIDYSEFVPRDTIPLPTETETQEEDKKKSQKRYWWKKDIAIYFCYEHKGRMCMIRNPNCWRSFGKRLFGYHEYISENYFQSIKPDGGYWTPNDKRVFISAREINDKAGKLEITPSFEKDDIAVSLVALILFILGASGGMPGWPSLALLVIGTIIAIGGFLSHKSFIKVENTPSIFEIKPNVFIEAEMILYLQTEFSGLQDRLLQLQGALAHKDKHMFAIAFEWLMQYVSVFEEMLSGLGFIVDDEKKDEVVNQIVNKNGLPTTPTKSD